MAKSRPRTLLYQHSPNVVEQFGPEDTLATVYPMPGLQFHGDPNIAKWVEKHGQAPDALFRQGLAAPPLGKNHSGLRHYTAEFLGDPNRIVNLDVPVASQTPDVRQSLLRLGISRDEMVPDPPAPVFEGGPVARQLRPQTVAEALWQKGMTDSYMRNFYLKNTGSMWPGRNDLKDFGTIAASGGPFGDHPAGAELYHGAAASLLDDLNRVGIHGAAGRGSGFSAGTAFAPAGVGRSPWKSLLDEAEDARRSGDVLEAQSLENEAYGLMEGNLAKNPSLQFSPNLQPKQYSIFDPNMVRIIRMASMLAAPGAAAQQSDPTDIRSSLLTP